MKSISSSSSSLLKPQTVALPSTSKSPLICLSERTSPSCLDTSSGPSSPALSIASERDVVEAYQQNYKTLNGCVKKIIN